MRKQSNKTKQEVQDHIVKPLYKYKITQESNHCIDAKHMLVFAFAMILSYDHTSYTVLEPQVNICLHHTSQDKYNIACTFNSISSQDTEEIRSWRSQTNVIDENQRKEDLLFLERTFE